MQQFRRNYRLLEKLFPRSGAQDQFHGPGLIDETVMPIWDAVRPRTGDVLFDSRALVGNSAAPGTFTLLAVGQAPPRGRVRVLTSGAWFNGDVAVRNACFGIDQLVGVAPDEFGTWWTLAGGSRIVGADNGTPAGAFGNIPHFPVWFVDNTVFLRVFATTGAGEQFQFNFTFVEFDAGLLDVELRKT